MTMMPELKDKKVSTPPCNQEGEHCMEWVDGDGVEWEQYTCEECNKSWVVPIEIQRDWDDAEEVKET